MTVIASVRPRLLFFSSGSRTVTSHVTVSLDVFNIITDLLIFRKVYIFWKPFLFQVYSGPRKNRFRRRSFSIFVRSAAECHLFEWFDISDFLLKFQEHYGTKWPIRSSIYYSKTATVNNMAPTVLVKTHIVAMLWTRWKCH